MFLIVKDRVLRYDGTGKKCPLIRFLIYKVGFVEVIEVPAPVYRVY